MTGTAFSVDEIRTLADIACDGTLTESDAEKLEQLLRGNVAAQRFYLKHVCLDAWLRWDFAHTVEEPISPPLCDPITEFSFTSPYTTFGHLSSGWLVSYLVAVAIMGIGLAAMAIVHVSQPTQIATRLEPVMEQQRTVAPREEIVGKITGMLDCRCEEGRDHGARFEVQGSVALGQQFTLRSGLMEITYDTGAKVILQGPVTYEVDSKNGGFLPIGKLTGKVTTASAKGFIVCTPTATLTDLGTEFGVEVGTDGQSELRVFRGSVEAVAQHDGKPIGPSRKVTAGQTATICASREASRQHAEVLVDTKPIKPKAFVRQMPGHESDRVFYDWQIGPYGTFIVAKDDLINVGQPTLAKIELTSGEAGWNSSVSKLNDGMIYVGGTIKQMHTEDTFNPKDGAVVTVTLNTHLHPLGYDIRSIVSLSGSGGASSWQDRSSQKYDLAYSQINEPEKFIALHCDRNATVDRSAYGYEEEQVTLRGDQKQPIAVNVAKLRFTFHNTGANDSESMYREIDVFGSATNKIEEALP